jgi:hypothetical protein
MAEHTIKFTIGADAKPAEKELHDIENRVKAFQDRSAAIFGREPVGVRRGARAFEELAKGITSIGDESTASIQAVTSFGRALSVGIVGSAAIGITGMLASKYVQVREEITKADQAQHQLNLEASRGGYGESVQTLTDNWKQASDKAKQYHEMNARFAGPGGYVELMGQAFKENAGEEETRLKYIRMENEANADASGYIDKLAAKNREIAQVQETRFRVGEKEAALQQLSIEHEQKLGEYAKMSGATAGQKTAMIQQENEAAKQAVARTNEQIKLDAKDFAMRQQSLQMSTAEATMQANIAKIGTQGLTHQEKSLAMSRAGVTLAQERLSIAQQELQNAQDYEQSVSDINIEEKRRAAERVERARAGVAAAAGGLTAAQAQAGEVAGAALERAGAEEEMTPQQKQAQYQQRTRQYEGLRHAMARQGLNTDLLDPPKFGEAEYDPTARYRAAVAQSSRVPVASIAMSGPERQHQASIVVGQLGVGTAHGPGARQFGGRPIPPGYDINMNTGELVPSGKGGQFQTEPGAMVEPTNAQGVQKIHQILQQNQGLYNNAPMTGESGDTSGVSGDEAAQEFRKGGYRNIGEAKQAVAAGKNKPLTKDEMRDLFKEAEMI